MNIDINMNMNMNMDMNNKNNKKKSVTFSEDTKDFDGTSLMNIKYQTFIVKFLNNQMQNSIDVYKFVKYDRKLLSFFFVQIVITILKLKLIQKKQKTYIHNTCTEKYIPKDTEELDILKVWDTPLWNKAALKKATHSNNVGILRQGSRDFCCSFNIGHIIYLQYLCVMLLKTRKLLLENASV